MCIYNSNTSTITDTAAAPYQALKVGPSAVLYPALE